MHKEFEDTKGVIRIRISKKNRQHNGQKSTKEQLTTIYKTYTYNERSSSTNPTKNRSLRMYLTHFMKRRTERFKGNIKLYFEYKLTIPWYIVLHRLYLDILLYRLNFLLGKLRTTFSETKRYRKQHTGIIKRLISLHPI